MATEKTVLIRYSVCYDTTMYDNEDFHKRSRHALAELFRGFASAILADQEIDLRADHILELSSETEDFYAKLVLKLLRLNDAENTESMEGNSSVSIG